MTATASDYRWVENFRLWPIGAYCLTFARGLSSAETLDRLEAKDRVSLQGADAVLERAQETWSTYGGAQLFVAVTRAGDSSVMFEENGFIGVTRSVMTPVSEGTSTVSHFRNINAHDQFLWLENGELALSFEPLFPYRRSGTRADDITPEMQTAGFDLREGEGRTFEGHTRAAFALAERLTGFRVTPQFLEEARYEGGLVAFRPEPPPSSAPPVGLRMLPSPPDPPSASPQPPERSRG